MERCGDVTKRGGDHVGDVDWEYVDSMWPLTSRTLKPTLDQSARRQSKVFGSCGVSNQWSKQAVVGRTAWLMVKQKQKHDRTILLKKKDVDS